MTFIDKLKKSLPIFLTKNEDDILEIVVEWYDTMCMLPNRPEHERERERNKDLIRLKNQLEEKDTSLKELKSVLHDIQDNSRNEIRDIKQNHLDVISDLKNEHYNKIDQLQTISNERINALEDRARNIESSKIMELNNTVLDNNRTLIRYELQVNQLQEKLTKAEKELEKTRDNVILNQNSSRKGLAWERTWSKVFAQKIPEHLTAVDSTGNINYSGDFHLTNLKGQKILLDSKNYESTVKTLEIDKLKRDVSLSDCAAGILISKSAVACMPKHKRHKVECSENKYGNTVPIIIIQTCVPERDQDVELLLHFINNPTLHCPNIDKQEEQRDRRETHEMNKQLLAKLNKDQEFYKKTLRENDKLIEALECIINKHNDIVVEQNTKTFILEKVEETNSDNDISFLGNIMKENNISPDSMTSHFGDAFILSTDNIDIRKKYKDFKNLKQTPKGTTVINALRGYKLK